MGRVVSLELGSDPGLVSLHSRARRGSESPGPLSLKAGHCQWARGLPLAFGGQSRLDHAMTRMRACAAQAAHGVPIHG